MECLYTLSGSGAEVRQAKDLHRPIRQGHWLPADVDKRQAVEVRSTMQSLRLTMGSIYGTLHAIVMTFIRNQVG